MSAHSQMVADSMEFNLSDFALEGPSTAGSLTYSEVATQDLTSYYLSALN